MSEKDNPSKFVPMEFCNERTRRMEERIESTKNEIIAEIKKQNSMSWQAKVSIIGSLIGSATALIIAFFA